MTFQETLDYLYTRLPMFTRIGAAALKNDLGNTLRLLDALGHPEQGIRCIHVGGTNGKGSVSSMLASVLQTAGYRVGLYTSPHLVEFTERIKVDGHEAGKEWVVSFVEKHTALIETISPSFFELTVAMAFQYFKEQAVDYAVIEVGMGGRLDSTNVITPLLSVITHIALDHQQFLGDTLPKIAWEKAGIFKPGVPAVVGQADPACRQVFEERARLIGTTVQFAEDRLVAKAPQLGSKTTEWEIHDIQTGKAERYELDLRGIYQGQNLCTALVALQALSSIGLRVSQEHIQKGLAAAEQLTGLRGRLEQLGTAPLVLADIAHNPEGIQAVLTHISEMTYNRLHIVMGAVRDKDLSQMLGLLPTDATFYWVCPAIPRGLPAPELAEMASSKGLIGTVEASVAHGFLHAKAQAGLEDLILVLGSAFVVAEVLALE